MKVERIDIKEFREEGYLQELNRQFLHPLGLALEVVVDENTGDESLGGIWDYRHDPEGIIFGDNQISRQVAIKFSGIQQSRIKSRLSSLGYVVQPIS